jgi:predicted dehydrogenase
LGAGNFANATLLPVLKQLPGIQFEGISSARGLTARVAADRFGFRFCTTDSEELLRDGSINTVAILTRHDLHAQQVISALTAGKHVFVEKPLCLTDVELDRIAAAYEVGATRGKPTALLVGYNRRFAPFVTELKEQLTKVTEPLMISYRVNAGFIPSDHWLHDPAIGGGRLLGEACHFIDLAMFLAASPAEHVMTRALPDCGRYAKDNFVITIEFKNGSIATVTYVANGHKAFGKEMIEVFGGGLAARLDNFRTLAVRSGRRSVSRKARLRQDKGYRAEWQAFVDHLAGKAPPPIAFGDLIASTRATLAAWESLQTRQPISLNSSPPLAT